MTLPAKLTAAISVVCPIHGVSIGRKDDKSTWRIDFKPEATTQQRSAAQAVLDAFVWDDTVRVESITMRQARLALKRAGLLTSVEAAIASMQGDAGDEARIEWEYAADLKRNHPLVEALVPALGITSETLDNLFTSAAQL